MKYNDVVEVLKINYLDKDYIEQLTELGWKVNVNKSFPTLICFELASQRLYVDKDKCRIEYYNDVEICEELHVISFETLKIVTEWLDFYTKLESSKLEVLYHG